MLFEELYRLRPELLRSKEQLTYDDAVANRDRLVEFLVDEQVVRLGRLGIDQMLDYVRSRTGAKLSDRQQARPKEYYLVRNIVAHKTGIVAAVQRPLLPRGTRMVAEEVFVSRVFLRGMLREIRSIVVVLERQMMKKYFEQRPPQSLGPRSPRRTARSSPP